MNAIRLLPILLLGVAGLAPAQTPAAQEDEQGFHVFTSADGRRIRAQLLEIKDGDVTIMREDGRKFTVPLKQLSEADRTYVGALQRGGAAPSAGGGGSEKPQAAMPRRGGASSVRFQFATAPARTRQSAHFIIRHSLENVADYETVIERVFELASAAIPGLRDDFERGKFRAPREEANPEDLDSTGRFRYQLFLPGTHDEFKEMVAEYLGRREDAAERAEREAIALRLGNFTDSGNRFLVFQPLQRDGTRKLTRIENYMAYRLGRNLLALHARRTVLPLWMASGFGLLMEHRLSQRCTVTNLDYKAYYDSLASDPVRKKALDDLESIGFFDGRDPWPPLIKKLTRLNLMPSAEAVITSGTGDLTPEREGGMLSLVMFLTSDDARRAGFERLLQRLAADGSAKGEHVLADFGFRTMEDLDKALKEFVLSPAFE